MAPSAGPRAGDGRAPLVVPAGERAVLVRCASLAEVHELRCRVLAARLPGVVDVVPGWASLLVVAREPAPGLAGAIGALAADTSPSGEVTATAQPLELPTRYDGPDLAPVADEAGCTVAEVVARHSAPTYTVAFLGFVAGFPYLAGLDPVLHVPRLTVPRARVPAGSVAIAGSQAGVYPSAAPGGWRLLGHTDEVLFDPSAAAPCRLLPGDAVRFVPVAAPRARRPPSGAARAVPDTPPAGSVVALTAPPGCVVVDAGRAGSAHLGVPRSGAFDRATHALANRLVGNPAGAAGLEVPFGGLVLQARVTVVVAVTGPEAPLMVRTAQGSERPASPRAALRLGPGECLLVGRPGHGARVYVAVRGGLGGPELLGSRSGTPVVTGDELVVLPASDLPAPWFEAVPAGVAAGAVTELVVAAGPDTDRLPAGLFDALVGSSWQVDPASDRTGVRLVGTPLAGHPGEAQLPSGGMLPGFVQLLPGGLPVVLGPDCGTTGGYPVVAVVSDATLDRLAQVLPGGAVRFVTR